ncbi:MAG: Cna B-type domain-containing protein, partial [Clostridiales bacterium]|nr:Cna B-type domain-containing protein [Clostridiales bacterium]
TKIWVDGNSTSRPSITIRLLQDGDPIDSVTTAADTGAPMTANADGSWSYTFTDLPQYNEERTKAYTYSFSEDSVDGYDRLVSGSTITNTLQQVTDKSITLTKYWVDGTTPHADRPAVTFTITGSNGHSASVTLGYGEGFTAPATPDDNTWTYTFTGLPRYNADRTSASYTISEGEVAGYDRESYADTGSQLATYSFRNVLKQDSTHTVSGSKVWSGIVTEGVTTTAEVEGTWVELYQAGQPTGNRQYITAPMADMDALSNWYATPWTFVFTGLDKYDANRDEIVYTVREVYQNADESWAAVPAENGTIVFGEDSYAVTYDDETCTITNTYQVPQLYHYEIIRNYTVHLPNGDTATYQETTGRRSQGEKGTVGPTTEELTGYLIHAHNSKDYTFTFIAEDAQGNQIPTYVTLSEPNHLYTITLNYELYLYQLDVKYVFTDGKKPTTGFEDYTDANFYAEGEAYTTSSIPAPSGYNLTIPEDASGTMSAANKTVTYTYAPRGGGGGGDGPYYNTVTVHYLEQGTRKVLSAAYSERKTSGSAYDVSSKDAIDISGYAYVETTGDALSGILNNNKAITVWYVAEEEIPEEEVPLDPEPPVDPEQPGEEEEEIEIIDEETPLGNLPQTGTMAAPVDVTRTLGLIALAFSMAAAGLIIVFSRKKEENET